MFALEKARRESPRKESDEVSYSKVDGFASQAGHITP